MTNTRFKNIFYFVCLYVVVAPIWAETGIKQVDQIIQSGSVPDGIVFEIVSRDANRLQTTLPKVQAAVKALRARYPQLSMTVVTHGREQFALTRDQQAKQADTHKRVRSLLAAEVQLHVCGTFASMNNVESEAFPEYVDVAAHGPELIKDYIALGYKRIKVK